VLLATKLQCSRYFKKIIKYIYKLIKNLKIILEIVNDISHNHAKSQPNFFYFVLDKNINLIKKLEI
jgi:hypothetical protein